MGTQRVLRGAAATLTYVNLDADGVAADAAGAVTVGVTRADGTVLVAAGTATTKPGATTGIYTVGLTPTQTAQLDLLTATWTVGVLTAAARTTEHLVVGGFMFSVDQLRTARTGMDDVATYDNPAVIAARSVVEAEAEWICARSFVPRYSRVTLNGTGESTVLTGITDIRSVRSLRIYSAPGSATYTTMSAGQLAQLTWSTENGELRRNDGAVFPQGYGTVVLEAEHGLTAPEEDMRAAAMQRCVDVLRDPDSPVPDRATRYERADGWQYDLKADDDSFTTGIDDVDRVYGRYSLRRRPGGSAGDGRADRAASRPLTFDPQQGALYRGNR